MTRRPTSCSSAATASSSRSTQPTARPIWSAARWVARAWTRKRSGFSSQPPLDSKKSKLGAVPAIASTPEGLSTSTASGMPPTPPATTPLRLAKRRTEIARATSDSTASTSSPMRAVSAVAARDHPLAGLDQDREALDRLEGFGEAAAGRGVPRPCRATPLAFAVAVRASWRMATFAVDRLLGGRLLPSATSSADEDVWFSRKYLRSRPRLDHPSSQASARRSTAVSMPLQRSLAPEQRPATRRCPARPRCR